MNEVTAVRQVVDRLLEGDPEPLLDLLAKDVVLVITGEDGPGAGGRGKGAVADYFAALGGIVAFWQVDYTAAGDQVIVWGKETFTVEHCEVEGGCELALVFDLVRGRISRVQVIEDLGAFVRGGGVLVEASAA